MDRFNIFTRFCYSAICAKVLSIPENVTQTSTNGNHNSGHHPSCMRLRNMTNEQRKRYQTREMWVTNDIRDHFISRGVSL